MAKIVNEPAGNDPVATPVVVAAPSSNRGLAIAGIIGGAVMVVALTFGGGIAVGVHIGHGAERSFSQQLNQREQSHTGLGGKFEQRGQHQGGQQRGLQGRQLGGQQGGQFGGQQQAPGGPQTPGGQQQGGPQAPGGAAPQPQPQSNTGATTGSN